ncbi:MAG: S41 family peptidase [Bellilinea sp.]
MKRHIDIWLAVAAILFTVLVVLVAFLVGFYSSSGYTQFNFQLFNQVYDILEKNGLKPLPAAQFTEYEMIRGLVKAYDDPYTVFVEPSQHELESNQLKGKFGGIGAALQRDTLGTLRVYPYPNSPAAEAGVPSGSILLSVDDLTVGVDTPDDTVISALRGDVGSKVAVRVTPQGETAPVSFSIKRREFGIPSVTWFILPEQPALGVVKITGFSATTADEISAAVQDVKAQGATAVILDLRDNGGGLVEAGVDVVKLFAKAGSTIIAQHQPDRADQVTRTLTNGKYADLPLLILVNQNTASSAEIVAGALQAQGRASIIGKQTYGKDTIQLVFDLTDGSSIHVTSARWSLPSNPAFASGAGIVPDFPLTQDTPADSDYYRAALEVYRNIP